MRILDTAIYQSLKQQYETDASLINWYRGVVGLLAKSTAAYLRIMITLDTRCLYNRIRINKIKEKISTIKRRQKKGLFRLSKLKALINYT